MSGVDSKSDYYMYMYMHALIKSGSWDNAVREFSLA